MKAKGFTLAELLIVVIIIGILATLMYPNFEGMRMKAKLYEVPNTVELIAAAEKVYYFKNSSYYYWEDAEALNNNYSNAETALNIKIPSTNTAVCRYRVDTVVVGAPPFKRAVRILFRSNDSDNQDQGLYNIFDEINTPSAQGTYWIDIYNGKWEPYLIYLE